MKRHKALLRIHASAHFLVWLQRYANGTGVDLRKQFGLLVSVFASWMEAISFRDAPVDEFCFRSS
jgi:hypothetical protein